MNRQIEINEIEFKRIVREYIESNGYKFVDMSRLRQQIIVEIEDSKGHDQR